MTVGQTLTDAQIEAALITWFDGETNWDKGMPPWVADQLRAGMQKTIEAGLAARPAMTEQNKQSDTPAIAQQTTVIAPPDYQDKLSDFLDALDEWGCEDNSKRAEQIIEFQRTGYDLDAYLVEHPDRDKSELN